MPSRIKPILDHQIEQILLHAHVEENDVISQYFSIQSSLDSITEKAEELLEEYRDPKMQKVIRKNLAECIVVKNQRERKTFPGLVKRGLSKMGLSFAKNKEILRAERLLKKN